MVDGLFERLRAVVHPATRHPRHGRGEG
jgi:hypothetical protein